MEIRIAGTLVGTDAVTHNAGSPGFGRYDSDTIEVSPYSIAFSAQEIIEALALPYDQACRELKEDERAYGDTSDFTAIGYCGLPDAIAKHPDALAEIIRVYLLEALFEHILPPRKGWKFVLNSVDRIDVTPATILLTGRCFRHIAGPGLRMTGT
ncbi:MAG: hypothetical protein KF689_08670 [Gemmatimonadaceae bacterium]|nr:hypothetical protein [Gemmatimonadaceae bacterium]MCW5826332.1 hypothetical protein [Gemmatimonadaceae bacterium]